MALVRLQVEVPYQESAREPWSSLVSAATGRDCRESTRSLVDRPRPGAREQGARTRREWKTVQVDSSSRGNPLPWSTGITIMPIAWCLPP